MDGGHCFDLALLTGHLIDLLPAQSPEFMGVTLFVANFDTEKVLARSLGISKQSTIVVFKDGKEAARSTGDTQYDSLSEILRRAIPSSARYSPRRHRV